MKKLFVIFSFVLIITSCSGLRVAPRQTNLSGYDFTPFTERGFLITPKDYNGEYESIGIITLQIEPAVLKANDPKKKTLYVGGYYIERITPQDALEIFYNKAVEMGADAIMNFTPLPIVSISQELLLGNDRFYYDMNCYKFSGYAIKRK